MTRTIHLQKNSRCGSTLIEVLLAAAMIAILAVVSATALMYSTLLSVSSARRQVALQECGRDMEKVAAKSYGSILNTNYSVIALNERLDIRRTVVSGAGEKLITVKATDESGELLVELVTERTP
jgi:Tfp pilus assembly protein PilE